MSDKQSEFEKSTRYSINLGIVTGVVALSAAVFAFFSYDWNATGICLGAAGLSFGLTAKALMRN